MADQPSFEIKPKTRREVTVRLGTLSFRGGFDRLREQLTEYEDDYSSQYRSFEIQQHGDGHGEGEFLFVYGLRDENDAEVAERERIAAERAAALGRV